MNIKHYKSLHFMLIFLLVFAPLRSVMAMQQTDCDMEATVPSSDAVSATMSAKHDMSQMPSMHHDISSTEDQPMESNHQCCCCDDDSCASNCDLGMSVSLLLQESSYVPAFIDVGEPVTISSDVLIRELVPPSRPPAKLS